MSYLNFVIPQNRRELLTETDEQYYVRDILRSKEIKSKLTGAKQSLKDDGAEFVIDYFDTYYSILHDEDNVQMHVRMEAYNDLHRAMQDLNKNLGFLLEDKDGLNDEVKLKYLTVMKMLVYIYTNTINSLETKDLLTIQNLQSKGRKTTQRQDDIDHIDKLAVVTVLNNIMQRDISMFWDPPTVEEAFINIVTEVYYKFLENPAIKHQKEIRAEVFNALGTMLKNYSHGVTFVVRLVQLIKTNEHLIYCIAEGIQLLITNHNCKSLVRDFVREITEWQTDEKFQDSQGTKHCSIVLTEMAKLMPALMIPEVMYLNRYLAHESYTLRNSVLNVIMEVILAVLTKPDLTEEEQESRDDFLAILEEHLYDTSAHVRGKIVQHWARLQKENAIPVVLQVKVLKQIVRRLRDKGALVRKNAANCVTSFLSHNPFGAGLEQAYVQEQLQKNVEALQALQAKLENVMPTNLRKLEEEWQKVEGDIRVVVENNLNAELPEVDPNMSKKELVTLTQQYIREEKYREAYLLCSAVGAEHDENFRDNLDKEELIDYYMTVIRTTFFDLKKLVTELAGGVNVDEDDLQQLETLQNSVDYFNHTITFLKIINDAIKPMADLLESVSINDMHEAVNFFIAAYKFNIDSERLTGLIQMLNIMKRPEQDRKDVIINAFKTIFLVTDAKNLQEHTITIVNRLIELLKNVPYDNIDDLRFIISDWVKNGVLDNSVIDVLWQYFTKKTDVSDQQSLSAVQLLAMAAAGRKSILMRNIKLVATIAFGERGANDMLLVGAACKLLTVGYEKPKVTDANLPFRIKASDPIWKSLLDVLCENMMKETPFYNQAISSAVEFIYKICSEPDKTCEQFVKQLLPLLRENCSADSLRMPEFVLMRCNHLLGEIAIKQLNFLDEDVYKELKRRNYIREERKNKKNGQKKSAKKKSNYTTASRQLNSINSSAANNSSTIDTTEETSLEGAEADDTDAQYILNVLENEIVTGSGGLTLLAPLILNICENYSSYNESFLLGSSITALLRYMIVSSKFCMTHIQLVFTILERTHFPDIKCTILIHLSDLLERYPNTIEPWTSRMYDRLKDENLEVRKVAFYVLANLLLRDMVRVKGQMSVMALCIIDEEEVLKDMSINFFTELGAKGNHLYNVLPDIFSHLCEEQNLTENNFNHIMKFLFGLIDKNKQMENLVDRFCTKFSLTQDDFKCRNIAYSLSLIQYNEKGLKKLLDNFSLYKEFLQNKDVYTIFKQILNTCSKSVKNEIKALATEIEDKINSVFEVRDGEINDSAATPRKNRLVPGTSKSTFKKPRKRPAKKKIRASKTDSSSDSD